MNDLINRQDAIDALQAEINKAIPPFDDAVGAIRCGVRLARNIIEDLPSAQPEVLACGEGELKSESQWIPCSERLPEENEFYLATIYSRVMQTAFCYILFYGAPQLCGDRKIGWYFMHNGDVEQVQNIIAWMPLPNPYKETEE